MIKLSPSLLAANILDMGADVKSALDSGADWLHLDMMDGHFVPNISYGPAFTKAIRGGFRDAFLDVHLMLSEPEKYLDAFIDAGADAVTIHEEIKGDVFRALQYIKSRGIKAGLSIKPKTDVEALRPYLPLLDLILVMAVEPGFGGQKFQSASIERVKMIRGMGFAGEISVDGGVSMDNAQALCDAGASVLVMGTAFFKAPDRAQVAQFCHNL